MKTPQHFLLYLMALACCLGVPANGFATNLVEGFESWTDTVYGAGWELHPGAGGNWETLGCIVNTSHPHTGSQAYEIFGGTVGAGAMPLLYTGWKTGGVGRVSFWYRLTGATQGVYNVAYQTVPGGPELQLPDNASVLVTSSTNYMRWEYTFSDPSWETNNARFRLARNSGDAPGFIFDDFDVTDYAAIPAITNGSYATNVPLGFVRPPTPYITTNVHPPIPSGDWWSSALRVRGSGMLGTHPVNYYTKPAGLLVRYPFSLVNTNFNPAGSIQAWFSATSTGYDEDLEVTATNGTFPSHVDGEARVDGWGDFSVRVRVGNDTSYMSTYLVHGSPYGYVTYENCDPVINFPHDYTVEAIDTNVSVLVVKIEYAAFQERPPYTNHYAIFAPSNTAWDTTSSDVILPLQPTGARFLSVACLPSRDAAYNTNHLALLKRHAYAFVTNTVADLFYSESNSMVTARYILQTEAKQGDETSSLMGLLPLHWKNTDDLLVSNATYETLLGDLRLVESNSFAVNLRFKGIVPQFPVPDNPTWSFATFASMASNITDVAQSKVDTYNFGKDVERIARVLPALEATGLTNLHATLLASARSALADMFSYEDGESNRFFAYDDVWGAMLGYGESFGSIADLNDHHFHYGMHVFAAAIVGYYDPTFVSQFGQVVDRVVREYANPSRDTSGPDPLPWLRTFDPWEGHSWASGLGGGRAYCPDCGDTPGVPSTFSLGRFAGADQESSSECMNSWAAMYLWGQVSGNQEFRDMGIIGYTIESEGIKQYWYDADETNREPGFESTMISRLFGDSLDTATFFSAEMQHAWGIQYITTGPHMTYQGYYWPYRVKDYAFFTNNSPGGVDGIGNGWKDIHYMYRCFFEPEQVLQEYNTNTIVNNGNTKANLYYWIHAMNALGRVDTNYYSDHPSLVVMTAGTTNRYVAFNFSDDPITARLYRCSDNTPAGHIVLADKGLGFVSSDADDDADGLLNRDEFALGSDIYMPDTDGDTQTDGEEAFAGTDPTNAAVFFALTAADYVGSDDFDLSWPGASNRMYNVKAFPTIDDLAADANGSNVLTGSSGTGTLQETISLPGWTNAFFRLNAE